MSAPPTPMLRPSSTTTATIPPFADFSVTGASTSNIQYVCDHFRSLDGLWKGWVEVAGGGDESSATTSTKSTKLGSGDRADDIRRQRAIRRLAEVFKHCYVTPLVSKLADAPTPLINRSKQKKERATTNVTTATAAGWGCFDDAVADDEAPPVLLSIPSSQHDHHSSQGGGRVGGKRPRDERIDQNGGNEASPLLFRGSDVLHADASSHGNALVVTKDAMDALLTSIEQEANLQPKSNHHSHRHRNDEISPHSHHQHIQKARNMLLEGVSFLREMGGAVPDELGDVPGRPLVTMRTVDDEEDTTRGESHRSHNNPHTPMYDLYVYEQLLPTMGVGLDSSEDEVPPALSDVHPLAAWLKICEMTAQECQSGAPDNFQSSIISQHEVAILKSLGSTAPAPLPLLLPLVLFVVLGFSNASLMERRLLQLLRRERRARKCASDEAAAIIAKDDTQKKSKLSKHDGASSTVKATPISAATYVKTKRGCLSLVCDDDDDDDVDEGANVEVQLTKKVESSEPSDGVSKILDYTFSQEEVVEALKPSLLSSHTSAKTAAAASTKISTSASPKSSVPQESSSQSTINVVVAKYVAPPPPNGSQTPQGRKSVLSVSDSTSPRQHPPRLPRSPSITSSDNDGDEDLVEDSKMEDMDKRLSPTATSAAFQRVGTSAGGGVADGDGEDDGEDKTSASSSPGEDEKMKKKNTNNLDAEVDDVDDFSSASDDDDVLGLCSDSSYETSSDDDASGAAEKHGHNKASKKKACAKCQSTKGDRHICPRCKLQFHEKCGGPHPREDDADTAEFTQLMKTISTADLSKKEVFGRIAGNFWGDDDSDGDDLSPHDRRLAMAATMVCVGCCAEQGLSAYRHEPASTPTHSDSGSSDVDDDDDEFSTDSSDIRAAELEEALDTSKIEKELALLRGPKYDPMKEKIKNDKLLLLTQMGASEEDDEKDDGTDEEEISRREKKLLDRKLAKQIAEENLRRRGCKYVLTEVDEEGASNDDSARSSVDEEDNPRRQKAEKGFLRHKRRTEERVKRIRGERQANETAAAAAARSGGGGGSTPNHPDVVIISPDTSQRPTSTNPPPPSYSSTSNRPPRSGRHRPRR